MTVNLSKLYIGEVPFDEMQKEFDVQYGDTVVQHVRTPLNGSSFRCWVVLTPKNQEQYNCYQLGLSFNPQNYFFVENDSKEPKIIKSANSEERRQIELHMYQVLMESK